MKRLFFLFLLAQNTVLSAQNPTLQREVLANAGGTAILPNNFTISWTLGEAFVTTRQDAGPTLIVTEGFQQPDSIGTVPVIDLPDALGKVTVSPNPAGNGLSIDLSEYPAAGTYLRAQLADAGGRILREKEITSTTTTLDLTGLPAAWYVLILSDGKYWNKSIKIVKQ